MKLTHYHCTSLSRVLFMISHRDVIIIKMYIMVVDIGQVQRIVIKFLVAEGMDSAETCNS